MTATLKASTGWKVTTPRFIHLVARATERPTPGMKTTSIRATDTHRIEGTALDVAARDVRWIRTIPAVPMTVASTCLFRNMKTLPPGRTTPHAAEVEKTITQPM